jgi:diguanylate cyclase (GGDEF)-like protein
MQMTDQLGLANYLWTICILMVISVSAMAGVLHLLIKAGLTSADTWPYYIYFTTGAITWLMFGLMQAEILPPSSEVAGSGYFIATAILLFAVIQKLRSRRLSLLLVFSHFILLLGFFSIKEDTHRLIAISLYGVLAYSAIGWISLMRARSERNGGHTLTAIAGLLVVLFAPIQIVMIAGHNRFDLAYSFQVLGSASGFILVGIGFLSSVTVDHLRRLRGLALRDPLTGLLNRRGLDQAIAVTLRASERFNQPICVITMDIDHFKRINDKFGHDGGDAVLKEFASLIASHARSSDVCARLGGEEFVLVMANSGVSDGLLVAERVRLAAERTQVLHLGQTITLTCSFGVTSALGKFDLDSMLKDADKALYAAKEKGRNTVCEAV